MIRRTPTAAVFACAALIAVAATGCSSPAPAQTTTPAPSHSTYPPALPSDVQAGSVTCAVLGSWNTALVDTEIAEGDGQTDAAGYAAVINTTENTLMGLRRNPQAGLQTQVWALQEAMKTSPPSVPGATFDPHSADFTKAVADAMQQCTANGTPMTTYALPGQG